MHVNLLMSNMTTIEMYEKKKLLPWRYDRGKRNNVLEVFGLNPWTWLIPVHTANQLHRLLHISRVSGGRWERRHLSISFPRGDVLVFFFWPTGCYIKTFQQDDGSRTHVCACVCVRANATTLPVGTRR